MKKVRLFKPSVGPEELKNIKKVFKKKLVRLWTYGQRI